MRLLLALPVRAWRRCCYVKIAEQPAPACPTPAPAPTPAPTPVAHRGGVNKGGDAAPDAPKQEGGVQEVEAAWKWEGRGVEGWWESVERRVRRSAVRAEGKEILGEHGAGAGTLRRQEYSAQSPTQPPSHSATHPAAPPVEALRVVLLQQLENGQQCLDIQVAGAQACSGATSNGGHRSCWNQARLSAATLWFRRPGCGGAGLQGGGEKHKLSRTHGLAACGNTDHPEG